MQQVLIGLTQAANMLLIGSKAWEINEGLPLGRLSLDRDLIGTTAEFYNLIAVYAKNPKFKILAITIKGNLGVIVIKPSEQPVNAIVEFSFTNRRGKLTESNLQLLKHLSKENSIQHQDLDFFQVAPQYVLLALKESHKYAWKNFHKTRNDLLVMRRDVLPLEVPAWVQQWKADREKATLKEAPVLKQNKNTFFTDNVPYLYEHDTIHEAVKHLDKPAYCYYAADNEEVLSDKQKFMQQPEIVKLYGVLEEAYVLALERSIIPHGTGAKEAFDIALQKVCTTITSGFFREYAWKNYSEVQSLWHASYVNKFNTALKQGIIEKYKR